MTEPKCRPILFSAPMVRALVEGRKTQTRRMVTPQPETRENASRPRVFGTFTKNGWNLEAESARKLFAEYHCPYGKLGDRLWVRESHYRFGHWEMVPGVKTKTGRMKWKFVPDSNEFRFDAPEYFRKGRHHKDSATPAWHKRLARFMPRVLSRITLEITEVRVQRLQEISEEDAIAEGIESTTGFAGMAHWRDYRKGINDFTAYSPIESYLTLWESISGAGSWDLNPWVWPVTFKVVQP